MTDDLHPSFRDAADDMGAGASPILGHQRAVLGAERFARFVEGHATLQAMAMFLLFSVSTTPQIGYSDEALEALRQDARDVRQAAAKWARECDDLADHWQAQRQEHQK